MFDNWMRQWRIPLLKIGGALFFSIAKCDEALGQFEIKSSYGKTRCCQRTSEQALLECMIEARKELVAVGLMEQAKDSQGQLIYHD
jgi:hypothetical protein